MAAIGIHDIPNELFRKIFTIVADQPPQGGSPSQRVVLTHVGKYWRQTALDMPWLWNNIRITNRPKTGELKEFLTRSKGIKLRITIHFLPSSDSASFQIALAPQMRLALAHVTRWGTLSIIGNTRQTGYVVQSIISSGAALESLLTLEIREEREEYNHDTVSIYGPFTFNPAIFSSLVLRGARIFCSSQICLAGITSLALDYSLAMLDQAIPNAMAIPTGQQGQGVVAPPVLPALSNLSITAGPDPFALPNQLAFDVSSLTTLKLAGFFGSTPAAGDEFHRLAIALSPRTLIHLELTEVLDSAWDGFIESISSETPRYPNLQTLTFRSLDLQHMDINVPLAFPALRNLYLFDVDATNLLGILKSAAGTIWASTVITVDGPPA
ncbi:hypothetical protein BD779DRAFT_1467784 [Infundibulicybe gibba]|nr:hypothetical protein BD779DRAFT_1467784 [Infundibulicybe gibba]